MTANYSERPGARKGGWMDRALALAQQAADAGEVPVGAVIVSPSGDLLAEAHNDIIAAHDPAGHAEILAIRRAAAALKSERLTGCDLYVTLEPCAMCAAAISFARIRRLYFAASDPKSGAVENGVRFYQSASCHHSPEIYGGIGEAAASEMLKAFFAARR
jgi:tRNA(adenine34) deaminase